MRKKQGPRGSRGHQEIEQMENRRSGTYNARAAHNRDKPNARNHTGRESQTSMNRHTQDRHTTGLHERRKRLKNKD